MKAMISQPMAGKTDEEIKEQRDRAIKYLEEKGLEVIDTFFRDDFKKDSESKEVANVPLFYLSKSIEKMSQCGVVYFCKGWHNARGCRIEHEVAASYDLTIIYEE